MASRAGVAIVAAVLCAVSMRAAGQNGDPKAAVERARTTYQTKIAQERQKVLDALSSLESGLSGDAAAKRAVLDERKSFEADASLPPVSAPTASEVYQREIKRAYETLQASWQKQMEAMRAKNLDQEADLLAEELDALAQENPLLTETDLVSSAKIEDGSGGWAHEGRSLVFEGGDRRVLKLSSPVGQEFDVEFEVARATNLAGQHELLLAFAGEQRGVLVIGAGEDGKLIALRDVSGDGQPVLSKPVDIETGQDPVRVLLSVRKAGVQVLVDDETVLDWTRSGDQQLKMPVGVAGDMGGSRLALIGSGAKYRVESLVHRVVETEPAPKAKPPVTKPKQPSPPSAEPSDPWAAQAKFVGTFNEVRPSSKSGNAEVVVLRRDADTVTLKISGSRNWTLDFDVNGKSISADSENPNPKSRRKVRISDLTVKGSLQGDTLTLTYAGKAKTKRGNKKDGKSQNNDFRGTIVVERR